MASEPTYYPSNGLYISIPETIYAQYYTQCPNPCRKYHVSSDITGASDVSRIVLPYLAKLDIFHKIVKTQGQLAKQTAGSQAGKFITIYMSSNVAHKNSVVMTLGRNLAEASKTTKIHPCPTIPRSRRYSHVFIEQPIDEEMFIYGGFICDPSE